MESWVQHSPGWNPQRMKRYLRNRQWFCIGCQQDFYGKHKQPRVVGEYQWVCSDGCEVATRLRGRQPVWKGYSMEYKGTVAFLERKTVGSPGLMTRRATILLDNSVWICYSRCRG